MSWEKMSTQKEVCNCGKGFKITDHFMDDWNRYDTRITIECDKCNPVKEVE